MAQRIRGQEVELLFVVDGKAQTNITDVRSFEITPKLERKQEGYLGETTDRYDEIYQGVRGRMEVHFENDSVFDLAQSVIDRARRRVPGTTVNVKATLNFPNGQRPIVLINDVYFGEMPINAPSRSEYLAMTLDFEASDFTVLKA